MEVASAVPVSCLECSAHPPRLAWTESWGHYRGGLESLIRAFKFDRHDFLAPALGRLLAETIASRGDYGFDLVAPVPMRRSKERQRGYNQADLLARELSKRTGFELDRELLRKVADNEMQSTLPRDARARNVRNVFAAAERARGKSVLVVDDICTTGETLNECARVLLKSGAKRVCAITVARA